MGVVDAWPRLCWALLAEECSAGYSWTMLAPRYS